MNLTRQEALDIAVAAIELVDAATGGDEDVAHDQLTQVVNKVRRTGDVDAIRNTPKKGTTP